MRSCGTAFALLPLLVGVAIAQETKGPYDAAMAKLQERIEKFDADHANNADVKAWPGVIADRKQQTVTLLACATGIKRTDPLEFYVTPVTSGKDYEALCVTPAKPSCVAEALAFVGLTPGLPIDPEKNRFWARGRRLTMRFDVAGKSIAGDEVMLDTNTNKPIEGSVLFAGSYTFTDPQGKSHFAADEGDAKSIAPTYEDPAAVLAVPRRAPQSTVYGFQKPAPAAEWPRGELVDVVLAPASGAHLAGPKDPLATPLKITLNTVEERTTFSLASDLIPREVPHQVARLAELANTLDYLIKLANSDVFTDVVIDAAVPVADLQKFYSVVSAIESDHGIKLNPPAAGDLYYRGFLPDEAWRDRTTRLGEPWELFLSRENGKLTARLERAVDNPDRNAAEAKIVETTAPADPAAFAKHVSDHASRWSRTIFIYPPADLTYGELMTWVRPVLASYPRIFVFRADAPTTLPATQGAAATTQP